MIQSWTFSVRLVASVTLFSPSARDQPGDEIDALWQHLGYGLPIHPRSARYCIVRFLIPGDLVR